MHGVSPGRSVWVALLWSRVAGWQSDVKGRCLGTAAAGVGVVWLRDPCMPSGSSLPRMITTSADFRVDPSSGASLSLPCVPWENCDMLPWRDVPTSKAEDLRGPRPCSDSSRRSVLRTSWFAATCAAVSPSVCSSCSREGVCRCAMGTISHSQLWCHLVCEACF